MVIQHNLTAMNSNRQLGITTGLMAKSSEKLSSGYKINRAADDAAGLSISEKMRRQIRGLDQAVENLQDGISIMQIADAALTETQDILQRANELAVKAANDTLTEDDRSYIQSEIDAIAEEIDHIATTTNFNDAVYPLLGVGNDEDYIDFSEVNEFKFPILNRSGIDQTYNGIAWNDGDYAMWNGIQLPNLDDSGEIEDYTHIMDPSMTHGPMYTTNESFYISGTYYDGCYALSKSDFSVDDEGFFYYTSKYNSKNYYIARYIPGGDVVKTAVKDLVNFEYLKLGNTGDPDEIWIHAGSEEDHGFNVYSVDATVGGMKIFPLNVTTRESALKTVEAVKRGLNSVSEYRSYFGAMQNRMEHSVKNVSNVVENTQDAESLIRDTDMATEMVKHSNENILAQAGQSMLAQANQTNQGVLSLLQ